MGNKHRDHIERKYKRLMNALCMVIHYNTNEDFLEEFTRDLHVYGENYVPTFTKFTIAERPIGWVLWQLIVCMYGDYGVSPRVGWITDLSGAIHFLDELNEGEKSGLSDANSTKDQ